MSVLVVCKYCQEILPGPPLHRQVPGRPLPVDSRPQYEKNGSCSEEHERLFNTPNGKV